MQKLLCFFGFHKWGKEHFRIENELGMLTRGASFRTCDCCGKDSDYL